MGVGGAKEQARYPGLARPVELKEPPGKSVTRSQ